MKLWWPLAWSMPLMLLCRADALSFGLLHTHHVVLTHSNLGALAVHNDPYCLYSPKQKKNQLNAQHREAEATSCNGKQCEYSFQRPKPHGAIQRKTPRKRFATVLVRQVGYVFLSASFWCGKFCLRKAVPLPTEKNERKKQKMKAFLL